MEPVIEIRAARTDEAPRLTEIAHAAKRHWGYPEDLISLWRDDLTISEEFLTSHEVHCAVAGGVVAGFYALSHLGDVFELEHMWVDPPHIGGGVGAALFAHAADTARAHGGGVLMIASDPNAEGFYKRMGAQPAGAVAGRPEGRTLPLLEFVLRD